LKGSVQDKEKSPCPAVTETEANPNNLHTQYTRKSGESKYPELFACVTETAGLYYELGLCNESLPGYEGFRPGQPREERMQVCMEDILRASGEMERNQKRPIRHQKLLCRIVSEIYLEEYERGLREGGHIQ